MYNKSEIMRNAWATKKLYKKMSFGDCLRRAWAKAKSEAAVSALIGCEFVDGMEITVDGYTRTLNRWTKNGHDRIYINGGGRKGDGYVDLKRWEYSYETCGVDYQRKIGKIILSMRIPMGL